MLSANKTNARASGPIGGVTLFENGTTSFVVPPGVGSISAVAIGAGASGRSETSTLTRFGGGGGALVWASSIPVTAGETLTLVVGAGGASAFGGANGNNGSDTSISRGGTTLILAKAGQGATTVSGPGGDAASCIGPNRFSGGNGDAPAGGGAGGYFAAGATGNGVSGTGGSGGAGGSYTVDQDGGVGSAGGTFPYGYTGFSGAGGGSDQRGCYGSTLGGTTERSNFQFMYFGPGGGGARGVNNSGRGGDGGIRLLWGYNDPVVTAIPPALPAIVSSAFYRTNASFPPTINIPADIKVGDVILFYQMNNRSDSVIPSITNPTNFTTIRSSSVSALATERARYVLSKRIVTDISIAGTSISVPTEATGTTSIATFVIRSNTGANCYLRTFGEFGLQTANFSTDQSTTFGSTNQTTKGVPIHLNFVHNISGFAETVTWTGSTEFSTGIVGFNVSYKIYPFSTTSTSDAISSTSASGTRMLFFAALSEL